MIYVHSVVSTFYVDKSHVAGQLFKVQYDEPFRPEYDGAIEVIWDDTNPRPVVDVDDISPEDAILLEAIKELECDKSGT